MARAVSMAALRQLPSQDALIIGYVPPGGTATVIGCAGGCSWLLLSVQGGTAWSASYFWSISGDLSTVGR